MACYEAEAQPCPDDKVIFDDQPFRRLHESIQHGILVFFGKAACQNRTMCGFFAISGSVQGRVA